MTWRPLALCALAACGGTISEPLVLQPAEALTQPAAVLLSASPSFADERGGGVFVDLAGRLVRLRANGQPGPLEPHPRNPVYPGPATAVWPLGPTAALAATSRGLFVADQGWVIAPAWRAALEPEGLVGTAVGTDAVGWVAHQRGLFRLEDGALSELTIGGASVTGLTHVATGPTADGREGVWFARGAVLTQAGRSTASGFQVRDSALAPEDLAGGVNGLVGLAAAPGSPGEVWAIAGRLLLRFTPTGWRRFVLGRAPRALVAAGRFAWLTAGDALYRYDADQGLWLEAQGLAAVPELVAADAAGGAWVRVGAQTLRVTFERAPGVRGLLQGAVVYEPALVLSATLPSGEVPTAVSWRFDQGASTTVPVASGVAGTGALAGLTVFPLAGTQPDGQSSPVSLGALADGWHTLHVSATVGGATATRRVHFEFRGSAGATRSWVRDIKPISEARCSICHATGTQPELVSYAQWKDNAAFIAAAVRDRRMPADGPLDPASIETISRWVTGGAQP